MTRLESTDKTRFKYDEYIEAEKRHLEPKNSDQPDLEIWLYENVSISEEEYELVFGDSKIQKDNKNWESVAVINSYPMEDLSESDPEHNLYGFLEDICQDYGIDFVNVDKEDFAYHSDGDSRGCIVIGR